MPRFMVLRAPVAREYGAEVDISRFKPGANINLGEDVAARWVRRGVLALAAEVAKQADDESPEGGEE